MPLNLILNNNVDNNGNVQIIDDGLITTITRTIYETKTLYQNNLIGTLNKRMEETTQITTIPTLATTTPNTTNANKDAVNGVSNQIIAAIVVPILITFLISIGFLIVWFFKRLKYKKKREYHHHHHHHQPNEKSLESNFAYVAEPSFRLQQFNCHNNNHNYENLEITTPHSEQKLPPLSTATSFASLNLFTDNAPHKNILQRPSSDEIASKRTKQTN
jgi:hypothetical protein